MMPRAKSLILAAAIAAAAFLPATGQAQDNDAARVAAQVQAFYDQTTTVRSAFYQTHYDRLYQRTTRSRGVLTIARPGKLRFDYLAGNGKVIVSDGRTLTAYEPGDNGRGGQYTRTQVTDDSLSALGFLTGTSRIEHDFRLALLAQNRYSWNGPVLQLTPRSADPAYRYMLLFVDPTAHGVVRRILIVDHAGNRNRFDFLRTQFNRPVDASRFAFTPPRDARRI